MKTLFEILAVLFLLSCLPALVMFLRSRRRFSGQRAVNCPESGHLATIRLDASHAAATSLTGEPEFRVEECSRWADPVGHCSDQCLDSDEMKSQLERAR